PVDAAPSVRPLASAEEVLIKPRLDRFVADRWSRVIVRVLALERWLALKNNSDETPFLAKLIVGQMGQSRQRIPDNHFRIGHFQNRHPMIFQETVFYDRECQTGLL